MSNVFYVVLPFPPSANGNWRNTSGRTLLSKKAREYRKEVELLVLANKWAKQINTPMTVTLFLIPPTDHRRDLDNFAKIPLDALVKAKVLSDDSLIKDLRIVWAKSSQKGRLLVRIAPYMQDGITIPEHALKAVGL